MAHKKIFYTVVLWFFIPIIAQEPMAVIVIGAGPAGLSAALYTARAGYKTKVFTDTPAGGTLQQIQTMENWPGRASLSGAELSQTLEQEAKKFGATLIKEAVTSVDFSQSPFIITTKNGEQLHALTVIIATGGQAKKLAIPGLEKYWGKGVDVCAICDGPLSKDKDVMVIGGSDSAAERAQQLAVYAQQVTMIVREPQLQAAARVQKYLRENPKIKILYNTEVTTIKGDGEHVTGVVLRNITTKKSSAVPISAVYLSIGFTPHSKVFENFIDLDKDGYIITNNKTQETSRPGIFAAGIVEDKRYGKAGVAAGNGIMAALDALAYLENTGYKPTADTAQATRATITTQEEFDKLVQSSPKPMIIKVYSPLCATCKTLSAPFEDLAQKYSPKALFYTIDIQKSAKLAQHLSVKTVPTLLIFNQGKLISQKEVESKQQLDNFVTSALVRHSSKSDGWIRKGS